MIASTVKPSRSSVSKDDFCQIMCIAYEIQYRHPDWDMDKCIEYAVKYAYVPSLKETKESGGSVE